MGELSVRNIRTDITIGSISSVKEASKEIDESYKFLGLSLYDDLMENLSGLTK